MSNDYIDINNISRWDRDPEHGMYKDQKYGGFVFYGDLLDVVAERDYLIDNVDYQLKVENMKSIYRKIALSTIEQAMYLRYNELLNNGKIIRRTDTVCNETFIKEDLLYKLLNDIKIIISDYLIKT